MAETTEVIASSSIAITPKALEKIEHSETTEVIGSSSTVNNAEGVG